MDINTVITTAELGFAIAFLYYGIKGRLDRLETRVQTILNFQEKNYQLPIRIFKDIVRPLGKESYIMSKQIEKILSEHTELELTEKEKQMLTEKAVVHWDHIEESLLEYAKK